MVDDGRPEDELRWDDPPGIDDRPRDDAPPVGPPLTSGAPAGAPVPPGAVPFGEAPAYGYGYGPGWAPGYGYGYGGYPAPRKTNSLAITSLVLGVLGIATCQVFSIAAVVTGFMARKQVRERDEEGAGLALAGIITGAVGLALVAVILVFFVMMGVLASSTSTGYSSNRSRTTITSFTTTTERITGPTTTRRSASTLVPSGQVDPAACPRVTTALDSLLQPSGLDNASLSDAARTLHADLPASAGDDVDTVFADALTRVGRETTGAPAGAVLAAQQRLEAVVGAGCP